MDFPGTSVFTQSLLCSDELGSTVELQKLEMAGFMTNSIVRNVSVLLVLWVPFTCRPVKCNDVFPWHRSIFIVNQHGADSLYPAGSGYKESEAQLWLKWEQMHWVVVIAGLFLYGTHNLWASSGCQTKSTQSWHIYKFIKVLSPLQRAVNLSLQYSVRQTSTRCWFQLTFEQAFWDVEQSRHFWFVNLGGGCVWRQKQQC